MKTISEKLEVINEQLSMIQKNKRKKAFIILMILDICLILLFALLLLLGSPYHSFDYNNPEWSVIGTLWHSFEWIFFRIGPVMIVILTILLMILFIKNIKNK